MITPAGVRVLVTDFRISNVRTLRRLTDDAPIEAAETAQIRCIATDAGRRTPAGGFTTDIGSPGARTEFLRVPNRRHRAPGPMPGS